MTTREAVRARRRQRRRRRAVAAGVAVVVVGAGAGTAWAMNRSSAPRYRLATVTTGDVSQVVSADGSLAASRVADATFAVSGTVASVGVEVGDRVTAGQTLATMDKGSLDTAVTNASTALATAKETLTNDEDGTTTSTPATATTRSAVTRTRTQATAVLTAARSTPKPAAGSSTLAAAQAKVTSAAKALATALDGQLDTVATQCAATRSTVTSTVNAAADASGTISGSTGADTTAVAAGGQSVTPASDGSWTLTGLTAANTYTVTITEQRTVVDATRCSAAVEDASDSSADVATALSTFDAAVTALQKVAASTPTSASGSTGVSGSGGTAGSGSGSSTRGGTSGGTAGGTSGGTGSSTGSAPSGSTGGSGTGSTTGSGGTTTVTVTSEKLAADVAAVGAAKAALAVAENQLTSAALTSPVTGTVASVGVSKGSSVSAGSSSAAIEVVADGPLSVQLSIPLSTIDLIKVGQRAHVLVDGRTAALPATVGYVGVLNSSTSTGSSSTYTVTVQLTKAVTGLYDGMGAQVSVDVGTAENALTVPLSALHTIGTRHTVDVYRDGTATPTSVTVGVVGATNVQLTAGVTAREQVVIADLAEATPTSTTTTTRRGFGGGTFGGGGFGGRTGTR